MKTKICLALAALFALGSLATANAQGISINIGDRPYYTHGPSYIANGHNYVWVPGHWNKFHSWVPGHYRRV